MKISAFLLSAIFLFLGCSSNEEIVQKPELNYYQKREINQYQQYNSKKAMEDLEDSVKNSEQ